MATSKPLSRSLSPSQTMLLGSVCVWALGASSEPFLLKRASDLGVPASLVPVVWLGVSLAKSGSAMMAGRLADSWHPRWALAAGWLLFAIAYGGLAMTAQIFFALPLIGLIGIAYGLAEPAERALVALLATKHQRGNTFGWYTLVQGLMALPAGLLTGWLWQQGSSGPSWALATTAALSGIACLLLIFTGQHSTE